MLARHVGRTYGLAEMADDGVDGPLSSDSAISDLELDIVCSLARPWRCCTSMSFGVTASGSRSGVFCGSPCIRVGPSGGAGSADVPCKSEVGIRVACRQFKSGCPVAVSSSATSGLHLNYVAQLLKWRMEPMRAVVVCIGDLVRRARPLSRRLLRFHPGREPLFDRSSASRLLSRE